MKLTFAFDMKLNETQEKIVREIKWHVSKVYNTLNYSIREGKSGIKQLAFKIFTFTYIRANNIKLYERS